MSDQEAPLTMTCVLDSLSRGTATYVGPNEAHVVVDRATYDRNGQPRTVNIVIGSAGADPEGER